MTGKVDLHQEPIASLGAVGYVLVSRSVSSWEMALVEKTNPQPTRRLASAVAFACGYLIIVHPDSVGAGR